MSTYMPQQGVPIIIKGGSHKGTIASAIEIQANSVFQVTEEFQSQANEWIQSDSGFSLSYVESVMIGEMGDDLQFCQTSSMAHPLTFAFKDGKNANIFTITEAADSGNYTLQISVEPPDDYFQITETAKSESSTTSSWSVSLYNSAAAEVFAVEVTDANNVPVCRLLRANEEDIYLNLEPAV
jgi:hypothetical protein